ncbi:hypothetical protein [Pedobacter alluvionis]|uniref:Uncharacterized protein n=1 Tax=Pedobacter alluvionis TaxID=475253 RepID=A0ABY2HQQ4_9SPHI|nr:hypothetical protein [Pedobacter alluvionis]TFB31779.1 hypothetical protein E3V97_14460 [Pedobacter alluvionis]
MTAFFFVIFSRQLTYLKEDLNGDKYQKKITVFFWQKIILFFNELFYDLITIRNVKLEVKDLVYDIAEKLFDRGMRNVRWKRDHGK